MLDFRKPFVVGLAALALAACGAKAAPAAMGPPQVSVATPLQEQVTVLKTIEAIYRAAADGRDIAL